MSADNAVFVKEWGNLFYVWDGSVSKWTENKLHKPPKYAISFSSPEDARKYAEQVNNSDYFEYGIIEELI
jgi:hypothetical protein